MALTQSYLLPVLARMISLFAKEVADKLDYFGIKVDPEKNHIRGVERDLSAADATVKTLLIPTDEELMIVRDIERLK